MKNLVQQELMHPLEQVNGLDQTMISLIESNHQVNVAAMTRYHEKVVGILSSLYGGTKDAVLKLDSLNQLYMSMYAHVDGCLRELAKVEGAKVFRPNVRKAVMADDPAKPATGHLGGDESLAEKLQESNKTNEIITKVNP